MMNINLNNPIAIGYDTTDKQGKHSFECLTITRSKDQFIRAAQHFLDSMPDISNVVMVCCKEDLVISFEKLAKGIGLKSKRYNDVQ